MESAYMLKNSYLGWTLSKSFEIFIQASLVEVLMETKFQVEIRKYGFAGKLRPCRENSLKNRYLESI